MMSENTTEKNGIKNENRRSEKGTLPPELRRAMVEVLGQRRK
jgi:hypothetical protein